MIFTRARVSLALLSLEEKWGTTRSLTTMKNRAWCLQKKKRKCCYHLFFVFATLFACETREIFRITGNVI